jgi:hypothetical protein
MFAQAIKPTFSRQIAIEYGDFVAPESAFWIYGPEFAEPWNALLLGFLGYCKAQVSDGEMAPFLIRQVKQKKGALHIGVYQADCYVRACIDYLRMCTGGEAPLHMGLPWQKHQRRFALWMAAFQGDSPR